MGPSRPSSDLSVRDFHSSSSLSKKRDKGKTQQPDVGSEEDIKSDEEEISGSDSDSDDDLYEEEDREFNKNYKDIRAVVKSLRLDSVAGAGLNISRHKIDEYFLSSKLRLNGDRVLKKSKKLDPGDYIDVISEKSDTEHSMKVKRVRLLSVSSEKTQKDKMKVKLRTWRQNTTIAAEE